MVFAYCRCGWSAFVADLASLTGMHRCREASYIPYRQFSQSHMAPDGVTVLLAESRNFKKVKEMA